MQRAAEDASFQPRFLHIFLIGTPGCPAGELPLMDKWLASRTSTAYSIRSVACARAWPTARRGRPGG